MAIYKKTIISIERKFADHATLHDHSQHSGEDRSGLIPMILPDSLFYPKLQDVVAPGHQCRKYVDDYK
jgi:hypothetical protein